MLTAHTLKTALATNQTNGVKLAMPELLRYRQHTRALDLSPKRPPNAQLAGAYTTRLKGRGMEFDESRHYQPGDDIRAIDWRVTARTGKTHTKVFREERERPVFVLTDVSKSMQFGSQFLFKSVQAAHLSALICWTAKTRGDKVGGVTFNDATHLEHKPRSRDAAVLSQLHAICQLQQSNQPADADAGSEVFLNACRRLMRLAKPGSLVWIVSDFQYLTESSCAVLADINRHCEVRAAMIYDPLECQLPDGVAHQLLNVTDGEKRSELLLGDHQTNRQYRQIATARLKQTTDLLQKSGVLGMTLSAGAPLLDQSLQFSHKIDGGQFDGSA